MAKKADLLEELKKLDPETKISAKNTIAEIEAEILKHSGLDKVKKEEGVEHAASLTEESHADDIKDESSESFAKAGKRSKKVVEETKAEAERQARKSEADDKPVEEKKGPKPVARPLVERRGKKYQAAAKLVDGGKIYGLAEALELATKTNPAKFDATVEMHIRLGVDPRQADQNIRATVSLPNGNGKVVQVAVFAPEDQVKIAKAAGADVAGDDDFLKQLDKEKIDFDVLISTPQYMPKLGKYARMLGPKGLMPNPKAGTVTADIKKAVTEAKAGKIEYRVDKQSIVHVGIGKVSFGASKLEENAKTFFESLKAQKPASIKGSYVKSVFVTTSQGPSIKVENLYN